MPFKIQGSREQGAIAKLIKGAGSMNPRGVVTRKIYTPARTALRNPYPQWHKICETLPLLAQNLGQSPYPCWHRSTKRVPSVAQLLFKTIVEISQNLYREHAPKNQGALKKLKGSREQRK